MGWPSGGRNRSVDFERVLWLPLKNGKKWRRVCVRTEGAFFFFEEIGAPVRIQMTRPAAVKVGECFKRSVEETKKFMEKADA